MLQDSVSVVVYFYITALVDGFKDCLHKNDVIPSREQRALVPKQLAETKHAKLLLKTDLSVCYTVLSDVKHCEVTEGLLIAVLGANFVLLFFIAWHVTTVRFYFRQVHRLTIAITETVRKTDCDELIDKMLSCSGRTAEKQRYEGTAGESLASPDTCTK